MNVPSKAPDSCHFFFFEHFLCAWAMLTAFGYDAPLIMTNFYTASIIIRILRAENPQLLKTE